MLEILEPGATKRRAFLRSLPSFLLRREGEWGRESYARRRKTEENSSVPRDC